MLSYLPQGSMTCRRWVFDVKQGLVRVCELGFTAVSISGN